MEAQKLLIPDPDTGFDTIIANFIHSESRRYGTGTVPENSKCEIYVSLPKELFEEVSFSIHC
jgi:hypothetical protein